MRSKFPLPDADSSRYWNVSNPLELLAMLAITNKARLLAIFVLIAAAQTFSALAVTPIDLKPYCNYSLTNSLIGTGSLNGPNNLASLPSGTNAFATVPFIVSGIIQLAGN